MQPKPNPSLFVCQSEIGKQPNRLQGNLLLNLLKTRKNRHKKKGQLGIGGKQNLAEKSPHMYARVQHVRRE